MISLLWLWFLEKGNAWQRSMKIGVINRVPVLCYRIINNILILVDAVYFMQLLSCLGFPFTWLLLNT